MSAKQTASADLQLRLELLRLRAAVERQALTMHSQQLRSQLSPQHWLARVFEIKGNQVLAKGFSLASQYPYLTSALAAMLVKRRWRALKWIGLALAVWQTMNAVKEAKL
jgi:hypothetical protein